MDKRHRSVIANPEEGELVDIVSRDILVKDCYDAASDLITTERGPSSSIEVRSSKDALDKLMTFQRTLRLQSDIRTGDPKERLNRL